MKAIPLLIALLLCSCMSGYTDKTKGISAFNIVGGDATRIVSTPDGIMVDGLVTSKSFAALGKAVTAIYTVGAMADVSKHAESMSAQKSSTSAAAGVTNNKTAAGVAINANNNATAIKTIEAKGKAAIGILKNTPTP